MKNSVRYLIPFVAGSLALAASAPASTEAQPRVRFVRVTNTASAPADAAKAEAAKAPREKVTFLGVETAPVPPALAAQLGLGKEMGLVVTRLADNSPAAGVLKEHDVLTKFADQLLVDSRQLSVLVRTKKPGDEVKLTIMRGGKETVVTAKLGEREAPRVMGFRSLGDGAHGFQFEVGDGFNVERLRELPGMARDELRDVIRIIGNERGNWFAGPRVHVLRRPGEADSTVLNLAEGNFVFSDNDGTVEVNASKGARQLTVKDAKGKILFDGPITTEEQRRNLPAEVKSRLSKIEGTTIEFEAGDDMQQEGARITPPTPRKASRELPDAQRVKLPASSPF